MRLSPCREMRPDSPALRAEHYMESIKLERILDFLDGNPYSPQENCHMSRGTLRSPQQQKRILCTKNQHKTRPDCPGQAQEPSCIHHQT